MKGVRVMKEVVDVVATGALQNCYNLVRDFNVISVSIGVSLKDIRDTLDW